MSYFRALIGVIAANWRLVAVTLLSSVFFFLFTFPFNDLADVLTSVIARGTQNQVYVQAESLQLHILPQPAVSASRLTVDTRMPTLEVKWAKITPGLVGALLNLGTYINAANGDPEASRAASKKISLAVDAQGVLGGDIGLSISPGKAGDQGGERSRIVLEVEKIDLAEVQRWAELSARIQGRAFVETDLQMALDFTEQPEGDFNLKVSKFALPASTVSIPMGEASFPINLPAITLANVTLRGRIVGGNLMIEEGVFGQASDPISGRIKGQLGVRIQPMGASVTPIFGSYNLTVDMNTNASIQKELGFAFLPLDAAKTPEASGGARYLFRATGQGIGMQYVPQITRITSF